MKSTLFIVCLGLALISSNAIGSTGGSSFRGSSSSSAPRMSAPSHSSPSFHSAPKISTPSYSAPKINAPTHFALTPSLPKINTPPRISAPIHSAPKINTPSHFAPRVNTPTHTAPKINVPRVNTPVHTPVHTPKAPVQIPRAPVHVPKAPVHVPKAPVQTPKAPIHTPVHTPVQAPKAPVHTPKAPVQTPKVPTPTPTPSPAAAGNGLSAAQLQRMMPHAKANTLNQYAPHLNQAMKEAGINTPARQNAFLAQLGHESGQFKYMQELASGKAYEGRCKDLGNCHPGDGTKYKGRGPIQITGRSNYEKAGKALGLDLVNHPELAASPEVGFRTAAWFWNTHNLNHFADQNTADSFSHITKAINGAANGPSTHAAERNALWKNNQQVNK